MESDDEYLKSERLRSQRVIVIVYTTMALVFAITALVVSYFQTMLGLTDATAIFLAQSFVTLAAGNIVLIEIWQLVFAIRD